MESDDLYSFLSDPELIELIEQAKVSDDILDVITLNENQHSDMLAWCLTPGEGHGQGDSVIKDFLEAAYRESDTANRIPRSTTTRNSSANGRPDAFGCRASAQPSLRASSR